MKKIFSIILSLALLLSMSVTAFAAGDIETLYIDIQNIMPTDKTVARVLIWEQGSETDFSNMQMTHVEGTVYSLDVSNYNTLDDFCVAMKYTDDTWSNDYYFARNDEGVNYFTFSGEWDSSTDRHTGTWTQHGSIAVDSGAYDVTGTYNAGTTSGTVYCVDISWSALNFTYREGGKSWDAANHKYVTTVGGWDEGSGTITVTNHSNSAITATPSYTPADGFDSAGMSFTYSSGESALELATADNGNGGNGTATTGTITVTPTGVLTSAADNSTIGTVTIKISGGTADGGTADADTTVVSDEASLMDALAAGGKIKLAKAISLSARLLVYSDFSLDLGGYSLTNSSGGSIYVAEGVTATVSNGVLVGQISNYGTLNVSNCDVTGDVYSITNGGTCTVTSSALNGVVSSSAGVVTLYAGVTLGDCSGVLTRIGLTCSEIDTSIVCHFDPSDYLFEGYYNQTVSENSDGTWTVTMAAE